MTPTRRFALALLPLLLSACAGPSAATKRTVNDFLARHDYEKAESHLESSKESQYGRKNMVLYYLDKGLVQHHAGKYADSDESLDKAETRMEELYTKSVTKASGMLILNDNTADYAGEPFERALTNVFRALNYVFLGKPDEAVVEARKAEQFLAELNAKRELKALYKDDAFARYLDHLLYSDIGKLDDARISHEHAMKAYAWYATAYNTPAPRFELPKEKGRGEIVFIHYNGIAPRKVSKTFQVAWGEGLAAMHATKEGESQQVKNALTAGVLGNAVTVAYPEYVQDPFTISSSEVSVGEDAPGVATALMEDISAIAMKDLTDRVALIKTRAIARATVKFILAKAAGDAVKKKYGQGMGLLAKIAANATAAATEIADTRAWATLPSQIRMARLSAAPGTHSVTVRFKDGSGRVVATQVFKDVKVEKGKRTYLGFRTAA